jgi:transcription elongation GreA/GreB family factor
MSGIEKTSDSPTLALKKKLIAQILSELERERSTLTQAALIAREAATHEESIAEDKYDTRGLEASYLAGAQAKRAMELERMIFEVGHLPLSENTESITAGSLVKILINEEKENRVFVVPFAAGLQLKEGRESIQVVTPNSPLGKELIGRSQGEDFDLLLGKQKQSVEILEVL